MAHPTSWCPAPPTRRPLQNPVFAYRRAGNPAVREPCCLIRPRLDVRRRADTSLHAIGQICTLQSRLQGRGTKATVSLSHLSPPVISSRQFSSAAAAAVRPWSQDRTYPCRLNIGDRGV